MDLGRSVCVHTYGLILKQNWWLHWGPSLCLYDFLNFLWPFSLFAFFSCFVSIWVLRISWETFWVYKPVWILLAFSKFLLSSGVLALYSLKSCENQSSSHPAYRVQCEHLAPCFKVACDNTIFSHCVTLLSCEQDFWKFWNWVLTFSTAQTCWSTPFWLIGSLIYTSLDLVCMLKQI